MGNFGRSCLLFLSLSSLLLTPSSSFNLFGSKDDTGEQQQQAVLNPQPGDAADLLTVTVHADVDTPGHSKVNSPVGNSEHEEGAGKGKGSKSWVDWTKESVGLAQDTSSRLGQEASEAASESLAQGRSGASETAEGAKNAAEHTRDTVTETATQAGDRARETAQYGSDKAGEAARSAADWARGAGGEAQRTTEDVGEGMVRQASGEGEQQAQGQRHTWTDWAREKLVGGGEDAGERVAETGEELAGQAGEIAGKGAERAKESVEKGTERIQEKKTGQGGVNKEESSQKVGDASAYLYNKPGEAAQEASRQGQQAFHQAGDVANAGAQQARGAADKAYKGAEGAAEGAKGAAWQGGDWASEKAREAYLRAGDVASSHAESAKRGVEKVGEVGKGAAEGVYKTGEGIGERVGDAAGYAADAKEGAEKVYDAVTGTYKDAAERAKEGTKAAYDTVAGTAQFAANSAKEGAERVQDTTSETYKHAKEAAEEGARMVGDAAQYSAESASKAGETVGKYARAGMKAGPQTVIEKAKEYFDQARGVVEHRYTMAMKCREDLEKHKSRATEARNKEAWEEYEAAEEALTRAAGALGEILESAAGGARLVKEDVVKNMEDTVNKVGGGKDQKNKIEL